jgi:hypothetical protein
LSFGGSPVDQFLFFVPPNGTLGFFLCALSYNGGISLVMAADKRLLASERGRSGQTLAERFEAEIAKLELSFFYH